jgi:S1-C subfamily serine protease
MRGPQNCWLTLFVFALTFLAGSAAPSYAQQQPAPSPDPTMKAAICPIVYPVDENSGSKGFHYVFYGNAFFINSQGYLVTAAHVLQNFRDGGQPYILVDRPEAPPQTLRAKIIDVDPVHDVAVLRAEPNPFAGKYRVAFLALVSRRAVAGDLVVATALHPANIRGAFTYQMPVQDWSPAQVLSYVQTHEEPSLPETDLFLFSHEVQKGQSGSPVLSAGSHAVMGLVDGRWLRSSGIAAGKNAAQYSGPLGAAVPMDYVIQLLQRNSVSWTQAPEENHAAPLPVAAGKNNVSR